MRAGRLMISAAGSGCGKSVVTMGLLQALKERGIRLQSFKCGPDYIDPGFHTRVLGIGCRNLDTYPMGEEETKEEADQAERSGLLAVAEGAMGLFDGLGGDLPHSAYYIASVCEMPVLVVLDAEREEGCDRQLQRLLEKDTQRRIRAVLINRCRQENYPAILQTLRQVMDLADPAGAHGTFTQGGISLIGYLPPMPEARFPSRHLGLEEAREAEDFAGRMHRIAVRLEEAGCVGAVLQLMKGQPPACAAMKEDGISRREDGRKSRSLFPEALDCGSCRIAVARDEAFSFLYQRSLDNLEQAGAKLCFFSPLHDASLPDGTDGLYLPGGYPELHAAALEENRSMRRAVRQAVQSRMPTVAECGGFLYLGERLSGEDGHLYEMVHALPGNARRKERLVRFGYLELIQDKGDSLLFREKEQIPAHEFHYWDSDCCGEDLAAQKRSKGQSWRCGYAGPNLYAAFPHLYLNRVRAQRFADAARSWRRKTNDT